MICHSFFEKKNPAGSKKTKKRKALFFTEVTTSLCFLFELWCDFFYLWPIALERKSSTMSDDSSDESWNASQVPSDLVLTLNQTQDRPLHNVFIPKQQTKQPLTTILKRSQTTRNKSAKNRQKQKTLLLCRLL